MAGGTPRAQLVKLTPDEIQAIRLKSEAERERRRKEGNWTGGVHAMTAWQHDPVGWIVKYLGVPEHTLRWSLNPQYQSCRCGTEVCKGGGAHTWDGIADPHVAVLETLAQGKNVAVPSGTGCGKTFVAACAMLWFLACFERSIVATIAPKEDQLLLNLWKEAGRLFPRFKQQFPQAKMLTGKLRMLDPVENEGEQEVWAGSAVVAGVDAGEEIAQRLKGLHGAHMLWIVEETPGVRGPVMKTIINTATGTHNIILALGNPESQHDTLANFARRKSVTAIRISSYDYPNVVADEDIVPGAISTKSVLERLDDVLGDRNHPDFLSQVRGIAPAQSKHALIQMEWCEAAAARWADQQLRQGPLAIGADVADSPTGDKSAISRWHGAVCTEVESFRAPDAGEVGRMIFREMNDPNAPVDARRVGIDSIGVGASAVNELSRLGARIRRINGSKTAVPSVDIEGRWADAQEDEHGNRKPGRVVVEAETYANLRAQVFWRLREDLRLGRIGLPQDKTLFEELTAFEYDKSTGKIVLTEKEVVKQKLGRSPDKADAVAYGNFVRHRGPVLVRKTKEPEVPGRDYGLERLLARREQQQAAERREWRMLQRSLKRQKRRA